jgi:hypothetical protein
MLDNTITIRQVLRTPNAAKRTKRALGTTY